MEYGTCRIVPVMAAMLAGASVLAADVSGRYQAEDEPSVMLTLQEAADGTVSGSLAESGMSLPLTGRRQGAGLAGTVGQAGDAMPFTALVQGDRLLMDLGAAGEESGRLAFRRSGSTAKTDVGPATTGRRNVVINGKRLGEEELAHAEATYRIRIADADYWYDPVLGAWGVRGGPTMGFIAPGLDLGGPMQADASGGGTNVFVNGRELHPYDLAALQRITGPIAPGRYFINALGLAGPEGGPPMWNLAALAAQSQGGGSRTWQGRVTGASGFSDGTTTAIFLPNGGIVSTGE
jgi:hypothetical protein